MGAGGEPAASVQSCVCACAQRPDSALRRFKWNADILHSMQEAASRTPSPRGEPHTDDVQVRCVQLKASITMTVLNVVRMGLLQQDKTGVAFLLCCKVSLLLARFRPPRPSPPLRAAIDSRWQTAHIGFRRADEPRKRAVSGERRRRCPVVARQAPHQGSVVRRRHGQHCPAPHGLDHAGHAPNDARAAKQPGQHAPALHAP